MSVERFSKTAEVQELPEICVDRILLDTHDFFATTVTPEAEQHLRVFTAREHIVRDHPIIIIEPNQWSDDHGREFNWLRSAYLRTAFDGAARIICPDTPGVGQANSPLTSHQKTRLAAGHFDAVAEAQWQAILQSQAHLNDELDIFAPWRDGRLLLNGYSMGSNQVAALIKTMPDSLYNQLSEVIVLLSQSPSFRERSLGDLALSMAHEGPKDRTYYTTMNGPDKRAHSTMNVRGMVGKASLWHFPRAMTRGMTVAELTDTSHNEAITNGNIKVVIMHSEGKISRASDNLYAEQSLQQFGVRDTERRMLLDEYHAGTESLKVHASLVRYAAREWLKTST